MFTASPDSPRHLSIHLTGMLHRGTAATHADGIWHDLRGKEEFTQPVPLTLRWQRKVSMTNHICTTSMLVIRGKNSLVKMFKKDKRGLVHSCVSGLFHVQTIAGQVSKEGVTFPQCLSWNLFHMTMVTQPPCNPPCSQSASSEAKVWIHIALPTKLFQLFGLQVLAKISFTEPVCKNEPRTQTKEERLFPFQISNQKTTLSVTTISYRRCYFIPQVSLGIWFDSSTHKGKNISEEQINMCLFVCLM